jgi:hypothetical protein
MALLELNQAGLWWANQTALGAAASTAIKKGRWVGGNVGGTVTMGQEPYADGSRFNSTKQFPDRLEGGGSPGIQGQVGVLGHLLWCMCGSETVTGTGPYVHTIVPGSTSKYMTWWTSVGSAVARKRKHVDCRPRAVTMTGATDQKVVRITPEILSINPDLINATDPVKTLDTEEPLLYTEGASTYTVNGTVFPVHSAFSVTISDGLELVYGDRINAADVATTLGEVSFTVTLALNSSAQQLVNTLKYGNATPADTTAPQQSAPAIGTYAFDITRSTTDEFKVEILNVSWNVPDEPDPSPQGGVPTITLSGRGIVVGASPIIRFTVKNNDPAYT